jgi:hypothetical protein
VNNANISTTATDLNINNILVGETANLTTNNKYIAVDNTSLTPILNADVQMHISKFPASIVVDSSSNIKTDLLNVTRQNGDIRVNNDLKYQSMESTVTSLNEAALKNTKVAEKTIEKTEKMIYEIPTHNAYQASVVQNSIDTFVRNTFEENITPSNAFSVINVLGNNLNQNIRTDNISNQLKDDKVSSL